jgi:hypothetical protein
MLDEAILLKIVVFVAFFGCLIIGRIQFWFVVYHVVQSELSEIEFLGLDELFFESFDV